MMLNRLVICVVAMGCLFPIAARAESWLCIADQSAGFKEERGTWKSTIFTTSTKILIKPLDLSDKSTRTYFEMYSKGMTEDERVLYKYSYTEFGLPVILGLCDAVSYEHAIYCIDGRESIPRDEIIVNLSLMRFQHYQPYGYIFDKGNADKLTPFIEIGTCSQL